MKKYRRGRPVLRGAVALLFMGLLGGAGYFLLMHPQTPLPRAWNPTEPLRISDPVTPLTSWKMARAAADPATCLATISGHAAFVPMPDFEGDDQCHIRNRVDLTGVGQAQIRAIETRCPVVLGMAMWERHGLQPLAREILGTSVQTINQIGSYNCRAIRSPSGDTSRMSTHATADAIDISGFQFADGREIRLLQDWSKGDPEAKFLHRARDSACMFFKLTLSPDYNALHADHFHLQSRGWGLCR